MEGAPKVEKPASLRRGLRPHPADTTSAVSRIVEKPASLRRGLRPLGVVEGHEELLFGLKNPPRSEED